MSCYPLLPFTTGLLLSDKACINTPLTNPCIKQSQDCTLTLSLLRSSSDSCFWFSERLTSGATFHWRVPLFLNRMLSSAGERKPRSLASCSHFWRMNSHTHDLRVIQPAKPKCPPRALFHLTSIICYSSSSPTYYGHGALLPQHLAAAAIGKISWEHIISAWPRGPCPEVLIRIGDWGYLMAPLWVCHGT